MNILATACDDAMKIAEESQSPPCKSKSKMKVSQPINIPSAVENTFRVDFSPEIATHMQPQMMFIDSGRYWTCNHLLSHLEAVSHHVMKLNSNLPGFGLDKLFMLVKQVSYFSVECLENLTFNGKNAIVRVIEEALAVFIVQDSYRKFHGIHYDLVKHRNAALQSFIDIGDMLRKLRYRFGLRPSKDVVALIAGLGIEPSLVDLKLFDTVMRWTVSANGKLRCNESTNFYILHSNVSSVHSPRRGKYYLNFMNVDTCMNDISWDFELKNTLRTLEHYQNNHLKKTSIVEDMLRTDEECDEHQTKLMDRLNKTNSIRELLCQQITRRRCDVCSNGQINEYEDFVVLPNCSHVFCINCLDDWLLRWKLEEKKR